MKEKSMQMGKRILLYCVGLFIMAMGVSFSGAADLGMSPVNSIPYVLSEIFTFLSMGTWIIIIFSLYIVIQFLILGRDLQPWRGLFLAPGDGVRHTKSSSLTHRKREAAVLCRYGM